MIGATDRGICFLQFGDNDEELLADLKQQFSAATVQAMPDSLQAVSSSPGWARSIAICEGWSPAGSAPGRARHGVSVDRVALPAEGAVWRSPVVLRSCGGDWQAERCAGGREACATNSVALLIPCHRVVRGTGELGGYRWGVQRKRVLLDTERAASKR